MSDNWKQVLIRLLAFIYIYIFYTSNIAERITIARWLLITLATIPLQDGS